MVAALNILNHCNKLVVTVIWKFVYTFSLAVRSRPGCPSWLLTVHYSYRSHFMSDRGPVSLWLTTSFSVQPSFFFFPHGCNHIFWSLSPLYVVVCSWRDLLTYMRLFIHTPSLTLITTSYMTPCTHEGPHGVLNEGNVTVSAMVLCWWMSVQYGSVCRRGGWDR